MNKNMLYRSIPKVDVLLEEEEIKELILRYSRETVMEAVHVEMDKLRSYIGQCEEEEKGRRQIELLPSHIKQTVTSMHTPKTPGPRRAALLNCYAASSPASHRHRNSR